LTARSSELTEAQQKAAADYAEGLAHWRAREFASAAASFARSAETDRAAVMFRDRAQELAASPPDADWDPVRTLQEK
jgi:adenylate cyclase/guanylate cyclase